MIPRRQFEKAVIIAPAEFALEFGDFPAEGGRIQLLDAHADGAGPSAPEGTRVGIGLETTLAHGPPDAFHRFGPHPAVTVQDPGNRPPRKAEMPRQRGSGIDDRHPAGFRSGTPLSALLIVRGHAASAGVHRLSIWRPLSRKDGTIPRFLIREWCRRISASARGGSSGFRTSVP